MANILAAQYEDFLHADAAVRMLVEDTKIDSSDIDRIVLGPPGRHATYPVGGDEYADAGADKGDQGAITGAAIGGAVGVVAGLATAPLLGPLAPVAGAALGAYSGSFAGALGTMGDPTSGDATPTRPAGLMVMVHARTASERELALKVFQQSGARSIEESEGQWSGGTWADFNPVAPPHWLVPPADVRA